MWRRTAIVVALVVVACSEPDGETLPADHAPIRTHVEAATPEPGPSPPSPHDEVLGAVDGFVRSTITANDPPDPGHPELVRFRAGAVLHDAVRAVEHNRLVGIAYRRPDPSSSSHRAVVELIEGDRAVVRNCVVDDVRQVALADGRVLNASTATKLFRTTLERFEQQWKVVENVLVDRWEGVAGCAPASGSSSSSS
jgi:hypothetical protein